MERLAGGETDQIEPLLRRHAPALRAYLRVVSLDDHLAEDVVQETFIEVFRARGRYGRQASFRSWLFGIARNVLRSYLRRRRGVGGEVRDASALADRLEGRETPPEKAAENRETAGRLLRALRSLPDTEREVLTLKFIEELTYAEISGVLGAPESTVKTRAGQGLGRLRRRMGP